LDTYVRRLSIEKALAVHGHLKIRQFFEPSLIIGCDQAAFCNNKLYGKPKTIKNAYSFFKDFADKEVEYRCGLSVLNSATGSVFTGACSTFVTFKTLPDKLIELYLKDLETLECASGLKIEGKGSLLIKKFKSADPTSILGLPILLLDQLITDHRLNLFDFCD
jgi:predicted house-cleaning NTP pyrophosphatase (Maf/HAM1 superfamily)